MKIFEIAKRNGKTRKIYCPDPQQKRELQALVPQLNLLGEALDVHHVQHGFTEGRSPLTNAKAHIGYAFTVSFDLKDFFDTVTLAKVMSAAPGKFGALQGLAIEHCFVDGAARQGLPTSPPLANIAASRMDKEIMALRRRGRFIDWNFVYTRYADDLTFSTNNPGTVPWLLEIIPSLVASNGFTINPDKTKVQSAKAGRRIITGVAVDEKGAYVPREVKRRIRAGQHQMEHGLRNRAIRNILRNRPFWRRSLPLSVRLKLSLEGLKEWSKLKPPAQLVRKSAVSKAVSAAVVLVKETPANITRSISKLWHRKFG